MSLILEALNRSQRERDNRETVPGIQTEHSLEPLPRTGGWQRLTPWVALVVALAVIAWMFIRDGSSAAPLANAPPAQLPELIPVEKTAPVQPPPEAVAEPVAMVEPEPEPEPTAAKPDSAPESPGKDAAVADLYARGPEEKPPVAVPEEVPPSLVPAVATAKPKANENVEQEIDIEKMIAMARQEAENVSLAEHAAPFLSALSQQSKDQIPTIYYNQHDYSDTPSQSSVTLNGEMHRQGASLPGGLKLDEILPDSIILSHRGAQFRLKALNSWINL